jgi:hypothetical protein
MPARHSAPRNSARPALFCTDALRCKKLETSTPRRRPDRGQHDGHGHPLCRHFADLTEDLYEVHYCARGNAENLIKLHKSQLASDRTSCRSANANQMRLILHTAAYWLMWRVQQAIPKAATLATAEFATLRLRLIKVAARVIETATRIRVAFASACSDADLFRLIAAMLKPAPI